MGWRTPLLNKHLEYRTPVNEGRDTPVLNNHLEYCTAVNGVEVPSIE